jgi:predicted nuclease with TOPRIM domain
LQEVESKQSVRDRQLNERREQVAKLQETNLQMKEKLAALEARAEQQNSELVKLKVQKSKLDSTS